MSVIVQAAKIQTFIRNFARGFLFLLPQSLTGKVQDNRKIKDEAPVDTGTVMIIGSEIIFIESLPSTNTYASELILKERPREGTIIRAGYQSEGRGQPGNRWESEPGRNLLFTIILYPELIRPDKQFLISMALSLGICDFLRPETGPCHIKWPNDIYVKDHKIAGILIENSITGDSLTSSVAGIGLNVNQTMFSGIGEKPVSMTMLTKKSYDLVNCQLHIAEKLDRRYKQLLAGEYHEITAEYIASLYRYMQWNVFRSDTGDFTGRIVSVTSHGLLVIENKAGKTRHYRFREVMFTP